MRLTNWDATERAKLVKPDVTVQFVSVVSLAIPAIRADLGASLADAQWMSNGYMLFVSALVLLGGAAGDVFGVRNIFAAGIAVFMATSLRLRAVGRRTDADRDAGGAGHRRGLHGAGQPGDHRQVLPSEIARHRDRRSGRPSPR